MNKIDLTPIVQALISLMAALITIKVIPYIKSKTSANTMAMLNTAAKIAVGAAEQIYKHGDNEKKIKYALKSVIEYMENEGFHVNYNVAKAAIEREVNAMKANVLPEISILPDENDLPPLENWPLEMIKQFCELNKIPCESCETKEEYIEAIVKGSIVEK